MIASIASILAAVAVALAAPAAAHPPAAALNGHPLAVASYCWRSSCAQPLEPSPKAPVVFSRGAQATVQLAFVPRGARLRIDGAPVFSQRSGSRVTWRATRSGGITLDVTAAAGWVTYVGRIRVR